MASLKFEMSERLGLEVAAGTHAVFVRVNLYWWYFSLRVGLWGFRWETLRLDASGEGVGWPPYPWWNLIVVDWKRGEFRTGARLRRWQWDMHWHGWRGVTYGGEWY